MNCQPCGSCCRSQPCVTSAVGPVIEIYDPLPKPCLPICRPAFPCCNHPPPTAPMTCTPISCVPVPPECCPGLSCPQPVCQPPCCPTGCPPPGMCCSPPGCNT